MKATARKRLYKQRGQVYGIVKLRSPEENGLMSERHHDDRSVKSCES